ncbi:MAG: iron chelate uptake ABC transporter family permease subunit [Candidatus Thermoplasmatota archaeon]
MRENIRKKPKSFILFLFILLFIVIVYSATIGTVDIPFQKVLAIILSEIPLVGKWFPTFEGTDRTIVISLRLPRIIMGMIVGSSLAVSGTSMQGVFKNPLASPFILGVSAGGGMGAAVGIFIGVTYHLLPLFAFGTALGTVILVFALGRVRGKTDIATLLLAGLAMNFLMTGLTSYIRYISPPGKKIRMRILRFMLGTLQHSLWKEVLLLLPIMLLGISLVFAYSKDLNLFQMGEESAMQLGVEVERTKKIQLFTSSLLAATMVAFTGVIGFVGLMMPHAARLMVGPDHKKLIPTSALFGAIFLVTCDTISRMMGEIPIEFVREIPVGIVTVLLGSPFFIYLLVRNRGETGW